MKITFVKQHLANVPGGAERALICLASAMAQRGHEVKIITDERVDDMPFYSLNAEIPVTNLQQSQNTVKGNGEVASIVSELENSARKARSRPIRDVFTRLQLRCSVLRHPVFSGRSSKRIRVLRSKLHMERPDIVIAFTPEMAVEVGWAVRALKTPCVLALRISPELELASELNDTRRMLKMARFYDALDHYQGITVLLDDFIRYLPPKHRSICHRIPNEVDMERFVSARSVPLLSRPKNIICVSSLEERKRVDWLIEAFAQISADFQDWQLLIFGEGRQERYLKDLAERKKCTEKIHFKGVIRQIETAYTNGQIICLPSRFEGIPRAITEGMASGLPAVGVNDCDGMRFLLRDDAGRLSGAENGSSGLANELSGLMASAEKRSQVAQKGKSSLIKFDPELIFSHWEDYFCKIASYSKTSDEPASKVRAILGFE